MPHASRPHLEDLPESAYARELRERGGRFSFDPPLERQYRAAHLQRVRLRVRVWFALIWALGILFTIVQTRRAGGLDSATFWLHAGLMVPITAVLAWLPWSRYYERAYLPTARLLVPVLVSLIAVFVGRGSTQARPEEIAALTVNMFGLFFFAGLPFRAAMVTATVLFAAFAGTILELRLPALLATRLDIALLLTGVLSAIVAGDVERSVRRGFLEGRLIAEMVSRDGLSGLINRRALDEHLQRVWQQAQRDRRLLGVLMIDIDHFKGYNDSYGHQCGDAVIRAVARLLSGFARRPLDLAARYGGEEFVVLLYDMSAASVADIAERLREGVQSQALQIEEAGTVRDIAGVTVSVGVAVLNPTLGRTPEGALQLADEALYEAKRSGRNRVVLFGAQEYRVLRTGHFRAPAQAGNAR